MTDAPSIVEPQPCFRPVGSVRFQRSWFIPSPDTLTIPPIRAWARLYLARAKVSVDPFARDCHLCDLTNDLNPATSAQHHMDALDYLLWLGAQGVRVDLCIFDPPYSRHQVKEVYQGIGRHYGKSDAQEHTSNWQKERDALDAIMLPGGVVLGLGWNSSGMTLARGYDIEDVMLVCHGGASNDTICIAERKRWPMAEFSLQNSTYPNGQSA